MKVTIEGQAKEIAALVLETQRRQAYGDAEKLAGSESPPATTNFKYGNTLQTYS